LNYDGALNFSSWRELVDLRLHPVDAVLDTLEMAKLIEEGTEIVITKEMAVPPKAFTLFPSSVRLLCEAGTGFNNLPVKQARERGVLVCNVPTYSTDAVAHMAITYLMNFSVSMFQQQEMLLRNDRANFTGPFTLPLREINDKTLGLVGGAGRIGTKVAEIGLALGMNVIISSRRGILPDSHVLSGHPRVRCTSNVDELLAESDYVSLHTPLNDETRGTFGARQIRLMKPTAFLINTSRGAVCNEDELVHCMQERLIAGAGLDVTTTEPPSMDSKLWELDNGTPLPFLALW
jgi:glycerate dehydrogenase